MTGDSARDRPIFLVQPRYGRIAVTAEKAKLQVLFVCAQPNPLFTDPSRWEDNAYHDASAYYVGIHNRTQVTSILLLIHETPKSIPPCLIEVLRSDYLPMYLVKDRKETRDLTLLWSSTST